MEKLHDECVRCSAPLIDGENVLCYECKELEKIEEKSNKAIDDLVMTIAH